MTTYARRIEPSLQAELAAATAAEARGHFDTACSHLERAHILAQPATLPHLRVHWRMFRFAVRHRLAGAAFGQAWRTVGAALFTAVGWVPQGNTGGSDVNGLRRMTVAKDLQDVIDAAQQRPPKQHDTTFGRVAAAVAVVALAASTTLAVSGCGTAPKELDVALEKASDAGVYRVALVPPEATPAINQMHSWKVKLATPDGQPVRGARFQIDGGCRSTGTACRPSRA